MAAAQALVIVGASYAGVQLAATARELGFEEPIIIVGEERHAPYQRPPLSKGMLTGKTTADKLALRGPGFFDENRIELRLGERATSLDVNAQTLGLAGGAELKYGWLALATGARGRELRVPGAQLDGVFQLRTLDDALCLLPAARSARRACVIGGGYIGLEVASALRSLGIAVTVVEAAERLLTRSSLTPSMSAYVENAHRKRGVQLFTGRAVLSLHGANGRVSAVELQDGEWIECDLVVVGIGVLPNDELAVQGGLKVSNGIETDMLGRTSVGNILAAGDVARMAPSPMRLESVQAANDGARAAASVLVGRAQPCTAVPGFWSDQFDLKFQMAGLAMPGDEAVVRGDTESDRFSVFYLRKGTLVAAHSVNRPAEHMHSRKLIGARARLTPEQLADESFNLKV